MCTVMLVEAQTMDAATCLLVFKNTLCTISEWNNLHAISTYWHLSGKIVHISITYIWSNITVYPCIQDTCTVDAQKHAKTIEFLSIVNVSKCVHTTLWIVVNVTKHTIYYT